MENGSASPVFRATGQSDKALLEVDLRFDVSKIAGTYHGGCLASLLFTGEGSYEVSCLDSGNRNDLAVEVQLEAGEELIGIFGTRSHRNQIRGFGFLVWRPPKKH